MKAILTLSAALTLCAGASHAQSASNADIAMKPAAVEKFVSGKTIRTYTRDTGNRIEYFAKDGTIVVWPARLNIIVGTWKACSKDAKLVDPKTQKVKEVKIAAICRKLPTKAAPNQTWDSNWVTYKPTIQEYENGDLFGLSDSTEAPYPMGKRSKPFSYFLKKLGLS